MDRLKIGQKLTADIDVKIKSIDKENFTLTMVASTQAVDRYGDILIQSGADLKAFKKNPVILNSHNYGDVAEIIAKCTRCEIIGKGKKSKMEQDWKFAVKENPKAQIIFDLYAGGYANASSVGLIVKKFKENPDGSKDFYTIEEWELIETSAVSVPANAQALAKSKGIDVDKLKCKNKSDGKCKNKESDKSAKDNKVSKADGQKSAKHGDHSKGKPETNKQKSESSKRDHGHTEKHSEVSYKSKVIGVIRNIENRRVRKLKLAVEIIKQIIDGDPNARALNKKTQEQIRKRKLNKAIRNILEVK